MTTRAVQLSTSLLPFGTYSTTSLGGTIAASNSSSVQRLHLARRHKRTLRLLEGVAAQNP